VIGHVGRLAPEKNLEYLSRSVCEYIKTDPKACFLVVGGGPAEEVIQKIFEENSLSERLIFAGKKCGQDLYNAYRAMNVFVFSSFSETQGMVIAEAMAASLPVVALDASGVREVIRHEKNGFLLPADASETEFAKHIARIRTEPELRKRLRNGARRTASRFGRDKCAVEALEFYEEIRVKTRPERSEERDDPWRSIVKRVEVEWNLLEEKAKAAVKAFFTSDEEEESKTTSDLPA
jgi:glycosyltransferase involved in cell wall biosynthesis